jgi:hypothetical protein
VDANAGDKTAIGNSGFSNVGPACCAALLKSGRPYADAVEKFSPYDRVQEVNEEVREGLREIVDIAMVDRRPAFVFVNNRLEGNSPGTIVAITD